MANFCAFLLLMINIIITEFKLLIKSTHFKGNKIIQLFEWLACWQVNRSWPKFAGSIPMRYVSAIFEVFQGFHNTTTIIRIIFFSLSLSLSIQNGLMVTSHLSTPNQKSIFCLAHVPGINKGFFHIFRSMLVQISYYFSFRISILNWNDDFCVVTGLYKAINIFRSRVLDLLMAAGNQFESQ